MKRHLLGCFALWMLTTSVMAQDPGSATVPRRIPARPSTPSTTPATPTPAVRASRTPATLTQTIPSTPTPAASAPDLSPLQQPQPSLMPSISPDAMTPELYLYLQDQKRHDDPSQAVRRKAEFKAAQRMNRMATMKWFGMSNARPQAAAVPMMGVYSPAWIGNGYDRYDWVGGVYPSANVYIEREVIQR